jgi:hypothetical protein
VIRQDVRDGAPPWGPLTETDRCRNLDVTIPSRALPSVDGMSTTTATTPRRHTKWTVWTCPNCRHVTAEPRKRCRDCGTSRY